MLTGGASQLAGVREVAVRVFDRPVRLGRPRRVPHLADAASGPAFTACAGIVARDGVGGLYRGFLPNAAKNLPNSSIRLSTFDAA